MYYQLPFKVYYFILNCLFRIRERPIRKCRIKNVLIEVDDGSQSQIEDFSSESENDEQSILDRNEDDNDYDTDSSSDEVFSPPNKIREGKKKKTNWIKKDLIKTLPIFNVNKGKAPQVLTPLEYFKLFVTDELVNDIVLQTNLYSVQQKLQSVSTTSAEIEQYIGMHLLMGINRLPSYKMYWSDYMRFPAVANVMSRNRFESVRRYLHFADNSTYDPNTSGKLFKVRPILESVREQCLKIDPEENNSIDEQIIPAKTKYSDISQ